ncbi:MAG: hypothetical protein AAGA56_25405 [Myxococcota bacterium]
MTGPLPVPHPSTTERLWLRLERAQESPATLLVATAAHGDARFTPPLPRSCMSNHATLSPVSLLPALTYGGLYVHKARPQWGVGTLIDSAEGRLTFQFEDGKLRKLSSRFRSMLLEAVVPGYAGEELRQHLTQMSGVSVAQKALEEEGKSIFTLDEQVALFLEDYEDGFVDPAFVKKFRKGKRRLKGHLALAAAHAQELLGPDALGPLLRTKDVAEIERRLHDVLEATSLLNKSQRKPLQNLVGQDILRLGEALLEIGQSSEGASPDAMGAIISVFTVDKRPPSWPLVTVLPALLRPDVELFVRESVFSFQMRWLAPQHGLGRFADAVEYMRLRRLALRMIKELEMRDVPPTDLLDVQQFVFLTLRPAARKRIEAMPEPPPTSQERPTISKELVEETLEEAA